MTGDINNRQCTGCGQTKLLNKQFFHRKGDKFVARCKICVKKYQDQYYSVKVPTPKSKTCTNCSELQNSHSFYKNAHNKDGLSNWCIKCSLAQSVLYIHSEHGKAVIKKNRRTTSRFSISRFKGKKSHGWSLTRDQYYSLIANDCFYCKLPYTHEYGIGLDRINNLFGYHIDNVLPCCGVCNKSRNNTFTVEEMIDLGSKIRTIKLSRPQDFGLDYM